jgi:hypothetical protein
MTLFSLMISLVNCELVFAVDSTLQPWLVNSLTLPTPFVTCPSYFSGNFKVNTHSVFADDFWSVVTRFSLTIPCVNDDSVFSNDFTRQPWISIRCQFYQSAVTQFSKMISRSTVSQFSLMIPCVNDDSVFSIDFIRQPWISIRCRFHPSPLT